MPEENSARDSWKREDSKGSDSGSGPESSWEFHSTLEAPIARLESLDEIEFSQVSGKLRLL